jgi:hypothetical protein
LLQATRILVFEESTVRLFRMSYRISAASPNRSLKKKIRNWLDLLIFGVYYKNNALGNVQSVLQSLLEVEVAWYINHVNSL